MRWFYNLKTVSKLILGFTMACALTGFVGYMGISTLATINGMMTLMYERELVGLSSAKESFLNVVKIGREARKAVLAETPEEVEKSAAVVASGFDSLKLQLTATAGTLITDESKATLAVVTETLPQYKALLDELFGHLRAGRQTEARATLRQMAVFADKIDLALSSVASAKDTLAAQANAEGDQIYASSRNRMLSAILAAIIFGLSLGYFIAKVISKPLIDSVAVLRQVAAGDLTQQLVVDTEDEVGQMAKALNQAVASMRTALEEVRDSSVSLSSSSTELASASEQLSEGAQEQASSLEETAASMEQITATVKQNADSAAQAKQLAVTSRDAAESGGQVVSSTVTAMNEINMASKKIADIIVAIDEIAFQTNILALNAAVEAARAGEQGRGFAVVAAEVRSLAQRSATAAKEIKTLIQDSVRKVENGSELVNKSGRTLEEIISSVKRVTDIVSEIAAASREQSIGIEQVNTAMTQMDQITQGNAAQTEELSATSQSMASNADQLKAMVTRFRLGEDSAGARRSASAAAFRTPSSRPPSSRLALSQGRSGGPSATSLIGPGSVHPREDAGQSSLAGLKKGLNKDAAADQGLVMTDGEFEEF